MSKLLAIACLCVLALAVAAQAQDSFESELALEVPEFGEHVDGSFLTLDNMGLDLDGVESSFAELSSSTEQEESTEQPDNELEQSEDQALVELDSDRKPHHARKHKQPRKQGRNQQRPHHRRNKQPEYNQAHQERSHSTPWHRNNQNQPVARHNAEIKCLDGDCTRATKVRKAAVGTHPNANTKPPPTKLDIALGAVKEEIMVRAKELHQQKEWTKKVATLIDEYQQKLQKVSGNIVSLRTQTKALLRKKKQIQNVQVQNKLRYKLKLAQSDLNRLQKQMEHIAGKENEFADTEKQLKGTMNALKNSLLKLRGQEAKKLMAEGIDLPLP